MLDTKTEIIPTFGVCLTSPIILFHFSEVWRQLQIMQAPCHKPTKDNFVHCWSEIFTGCMPFPSPNQPYQSNEGQSGKEVNTITPNIFQQT